MADKRESRYGDWLNKQGANVGGLIPTTGRYNKTIESKRGPYAPGQPGYPEYNPGYIKTIEPLRPHWMKRDYGEGNLKEGTIERWRERTGNKLDENIETVVGDWLNNGKAPMKLGEQFHKEMMDEFLDVLSNEAKDVPIDSTYLDKAYKHFAIDFISGLLKEETEEQAKNLKNSQEYKKW